MTAFEDEKQFATLRDSSTKKADVLKILSGLAQRESFSRGEHHLDTPITRNATLHAVENVVIPALRKRQRIGTCLDVVDFLSDPSMKLDLSEERSAEAVEDEESKFFARDLSEMLLRNADAFIRNFGNKEYGADMVRRFLTTLGRAKELGVYDQFALALQHRLHKAIPRMKSSVEVLTDDTNPLMRKDVLLLALQFGNDEDRAWANSILHHDLFERTPGVWSPSLARRYLQHAIETESSDSQRLTHSSLENIKPIFERFGVSMGGSLLSWRDSHASIPYETYVRSNLSAMMELEVRKKGSVRWLSATCGMRAYDRYKKSMLLTQYDQRDSIREMKRAPVIVVTGQFDVDDKGSSALSSANVWHFVDGVHEPFAELENPPPLILMEANEPRALLRRLSDMAQNISPTVLGKTTLVFNAHGRTIGILLSQIGKSGTGRRITQTSLKRLQQPRMHQFIPKFPNGIVSILCACNAGKGEKSPAKTFAPFGQTYAADGMIYGPPKITVIDTEHGAEITEVQVNVAGKGLVPMQRFEKPAQSEA
jgi:hypothetical protein